MLLCSKDQDKMVEALVPHHDVEREVLDVLGAEDEDVLIAQANIAGVLNSQGKLDEAHVLFREAERQKLGILMTEDPFVCVKQAEIACALRNENELH